MQRVPSKEIVEVDHSHLTDLNQIKADIWV
jgi:hypothetical protein